MEPWRCRVLLLDDGEVEAGRFRFRLAALGVHLVVTHDLFEVPGLLATRDFEVIIGHELLLSFAWQTAYAARRCLLVNARGPWRVPTVPVPTVHAVLSREVSDAQLLESLGVLEAWPLRLAS